MDVVYLHFTLLRTPDRRTSFCVNFLKMPDLLSKEIIVKDFRLEEATWLEPFSGLISSYF